MLLVQRLRVLENWQRNPRSQCPPYLSMVFLDVSRSMPLVSVSTPIFAGLTPLNGQNSILRLGSRGHAIISTLESFATDVHVASTTLLSLLENTLASNTSRGLIPASEEAHAEMRNAITVTYVRKKDVKMATRYHAGSAPMHMLWIYESPTGCDLGVATIKPKAEATSGLTRVVLRGQWSLCIPQSTSS